MPYRPTQDYILILPITQKLSSVIEVVNRESFHRGMICAVGPGDYPKYQDGPRKGLYVTNGVFQPTQVKPGDFIAYVDLGHISNYYKSYEEDGVHYLIGQEKDITFVADRDYIDPDREVSDERMYELITTHNGVLA